MLPQLPDDLRKLVSHMSWEKESIGRSDAQVYCLSDGRETYYLKISPPSVESRREREMFAWLAGKVPVPEIIYSEDGDYLLTRKLPGAMACSRHHVSNPVETIRALASGLQLLWAVDVADCPYANGLDEKLAAAYDRIRNKQIDMSDWEESTKFPSPEALHQWLQDHRPVEQFVLSHGDYCLPNVFLKDGCVSGFLDLGRAGTGDAWNDIGICIRSMRSNIPDAERYFNDFFAVLEKQPDWDLIEYYILLDELF